MKKIIAIGADHGGFYLKEKIKKVLAEKKYIVFDGGTHSSEACDYPSFGFDVAKKVSEKKAQKAILICKTGIGMTIIANKLSGVRAGLCSSVEDAVSSRMHNDANILVLAGSKRSVKKAKEIVEVWLKTKTLKGRHARRVKQIAELEKKVFKKIK